MANLSCDSTSAHALVSEGIMASFQLALASNDFLNQRYASLGIANLTTTPEVQAEVIGEGCVPTLVDLFMGKVGDLECQRYATIAMANLAVLHSNHELLEGTHHCVSVFAKYLDHPDRELRNSSALALANMSANPACHRAILDTGCVSKLLPFLAANTEDKMLQLHAMSVFRGLTVSEASRSEVLGAELIVPVLHLLGTDVPSIRLEALMCLCNLALTGFIADYADLVLQHISIEEIMACLRSSESARRLFGALAIGNLAFHGERHSLLLEAGALEALTEIYERADDETARCVAL